MVFSLQDSPEEYVDNPDNREPRPKASNQEKRYLMVPQEWVIDCMNAKDVNSLNECLMGSTMGNAIFQATGIQAGRLSGKKTGTTDGRAVYQDTNNSAEDMEVTL